MGLFDFFGESDGKELFDARAPAAEKAAAIRAEFERLGLPGAVTITVHGDCVKLIGHVPDQATKEKLMLVAGNVRHICSVDDQLRADAHASDQLGQSRAPWRIGGPPLGLMTQARSTFYTVEPDETLAMIAEQFYGKAEDAALILEANRPMISGPEDLYPGQVLRIPMVG